MKLSLVASQILLAVRLWAIIVPANGAVTFYDDKDKFIKALNGATTRTTVACTPWEMENQMLPFSQGDLSIASIRSWGNQFMQVYNNKNPNFSEVPVYKITTHDTLDQANNRGAQIDVSYPFYAIGFDAASSGRQDSFAIKVFDDVLREYPANDANANQGSKFYGWISDSDPVSDFQIGGGPATQNGGKKFEFLITNFIYAVEDGSEPTEFGDDCDNYDPVYVPKVCTASAWGDPHIITFDGLKYDAQPFGEAIFLKSTTSEFQIQGRLEKAGNFVFDPAVTTGVAVMGDVSDSQTVVQVAMASADSQHASNTVPAIGWGFQCPVELYVDGQLSSSISYSPGSDGPQVEMTGSTIKIEYPSLVSIEMTAMYFGRCFFSVDFHLLDCKAHEDSVIGLLGTPNEDPLDDWRTYNGDVLQIPHGARQMFFQPAFDYTKDNWIIGDETKSLFSYEVGKTFADYSNPLQEYDPEFEDWVDHPDPELAAKCGDDIGCVIDGRTLGIDAAQQYLDTPAAKRTPSPTVSPRPTDNPTATPTKEPTPEPTEPTDDCIFSSGVVGSEFGSICGHTGIGLVNSIPEIVELESPALALSALEDMFFDIEAGADSTTVSFAMRNPFDFKLGMYVQYAKPIEGGIGHNRETTCVGKPDLDKCGATDTDVFEAGCITRGTQPYALVTAYFVDSSYSFFDIEQSATVDQCCHPTQTDGAEVVEYTFLIPCSCSEEYTPDRNLRGSM